MKTFLMLLAIMCTCGGGLAADYGVKTRFAKGKPLAFPDCELTFTGTRRIVSPAYSRGFLYYDFKAAVGGKTKDVSWSSGTGDIGPEFFEVNGRKFVIELGATILAKGFMKNDELVLWPETLFLKAKK